MKYNRLPWELRFKLKIWQRGDCWEWRGTRNAAGYGLFGMYGAEGQLGGHVSAHRMAYEMAKGTIPAHLEIDHICKHQWCVRPSHLEAVTRRVNTLRSGNRCAIAARQTHCKRGHLLVKRDTNGKRFCQDCKREHDRAIQRDPEKRAHKNDLQRAAYRRRKSVAAD